MFRAVGIFFLSIVLLSGVFLSGSARADQAGPFGAGFILGNPTGLSFNYFMSKERSIDAALAWFFSNETGIEIHVDYLWHRPHVFNLGRAPIDWHYGAGGRLFSVNTARNSDSNKTRLGPRFPIGLGTTFNHSTVEVFTELALIMNLVPSTSADLDFGIGARVYF